jgi:capsular exopolysaccharide synthesis family protein
MISESNGNGKSLHPEEEILHFNAVRDNEETAEDFLSELDLPRIWSIIAKNWIWLMALFFVFPIAGYLYLRYTKPLYESYSTLRLSVKSNPNVLGIAGLSDENIASLQGEIELLRSDLIFQEVIRQMNLDVSYYVTGKILDEERYKTSPFSVQYQVKNEMIYDIPFTVQLLDNKTFEISYQLRGKEYSHKQPLGVTLHTDDFSFNIRLTPFFTPEYTHNRFYFTINSQNTLYEYLSKNLRIEILNGNANKIGVFFKDYNTFKARDIVNKIDTIYLRKTLEVKNKSNAQKEEFLKDRLLQVEDSLTHYQWQIENFAVKEKSMDINSDFSKSLEKLEKVLEERVSLISQQAQLQSLQETIEKGNKFDELLPPFLPTDNPQIQTWLNNVNRLQQERDLMANSMKESTYSLQIKEKELKKAKNNLLLVISQSKGFLTGKLTATERKIAELENNFNMLPSKSGQYARLKMFKDLYQRFYLQMMERQAEIGIAGAGTTPDFVILSPAFIPRSPISPNKIMIYMIGAGAGLVVCLLIVFLKYLLYNTVSTQRDIEKITTAPILGVIPAYTREKMPTSRLIIDKNPKAAISESLRVIRTNMDFIMSSKKKKKIISVTSTISGEGKTFVALNLSGVIAFSHQKVVMLDLDMRKPKLHLAFEASNDKGISTILIGRHTWQDCIAHTSVNGLDFIAAGPPPPNPSELIMRQDFDDLLKQLLLHYDVIVIDTPPVGLVTDGILVMQKADLPVYVVRADYSKRAFIKNINRLTEKLNFHKLSVILNAYRGGEGYGYEYGYGYYEDEKSYKK